MINNKADEVIEKLFDLLNKKYQIGLEKPMNGSDFMFDCVHLSYYKCHKINPNRGEWNIDYSDWVKNKKPTKNPINKKIINAFKFLQ